MPSAASAPLPVGQAVALGLLHGPAELLPISSSGHVTLVPWLLGWSYPERDPALRKSLEVALHAGTAAALLIALRDEVSDVAHNLDRRRIALLVLSFAPPAAAGLALESTIERRLGTPATIAAGLVAGSLAMAVADVLSASNRRRAEAGALDGLTLGLAQALSLMPGVSRNGATLAAARARGFSRRDASVLSRHVALPVIAGASLLRGRRLWARLREGEPAASSSLVALACGAGASFGSTLASATLVRRLERGRSPAPYVLYRLGLAALVVRRLRFNGRR